MKTVHEFLSEQFHQWEQRGRGWKVFDYPVAPEPPFVPFEYHLETQPEPDDGRRSTLLNSFVKRLSHKLAPQTPPPLPEPEPEPQPEHVERSSVIELQLSLPDGFDPEPFDLTFLSQCRQPFCFELLGLPDAVRTQFVVDPDDSSLVRKQIEGRFPDVAVLPEEGVLHSVWRDRDEAETAVVEFGLAREFMFLLNTCPVDALGGIAAALGELQEGELGLFQVILQPAREPWRDGVLRAVLDKDGEPLFDNVPDLMEQTEEKIRHVFFAVVIRIAAQAGDFNRAWEIARQMASGLRVLGRADGNELIPLHNKEYPFEFHVEDVLRRQSRRCGMLLNSQELAGFVHLPTASVPNLNRKVVKTNAAPASAGGVLIGENVHRAKTTEVRLSPEHRVRHTHIIGASGTGKSTLLFNLIRQDIENGEGVAVLDPHGDLVNKLLGIVPAGRIEDVVVIDPSDQEYSVGFNMLSAHSELEKNLLTSDLVSVFQRLSSSWGDQMGSVLRNAIAAFLESSKGGTLADLRRFLLEPDYRNEFLSTVSDPEIVYYWRKAFAQLAGNKSIGPVLTRLEIFLGRKPIRYMLSQPVNRLDFAQIMDTGKIVLANLSQGLIGKENSYLLGSLLVARFQQTAMSRQAQAVRRDFWLYADEFQNFITPSMAEILAGARKYRLGLILAHQELRHLDRDRDVASAVFNCGTRIVFRVSDDDARKLADGFAHFEARDLQNLDTGQALCRIERSDRDFNIAVPFPKEPDPVGARQRREQVITASRNKYGTPRGEVEAMLLRAQPGGDSGGPSDLVPPRRPPQPTPTVPPPPAEPPPVPKVSAVPKVSEVPEPPPPTHQATSEARGIGGNQHNLVRQRIEDVARPLGYSATRERYVQDGRKIDLALERPGQFIGCEISFTTTVDHEVGNVSKCLEAGCHHVAVICSDEGRLSKIRQAVTGCMGAEASARVGYYLLEQFLSRLPDFVGQETTPKTPETVRRGKFTVRRRGPKTPSSERLAHEEVAIRAIAAAMKR